MSSPTGCYFGGACELSQLSNLKVFEEPFWVFVVKINTRKFSKIHTNWEIHTNRKLSNETKLGKKN